MKFNPKDHLMQMSGKDYLEVKWRQVWFREEHPNGGIITDLANLEPALMYAKVIDEEGRVLGTGYGTPKKQGKAASRPFEGAETAAIGRALANAGFGTQFTGEEEGEHLADSPIEKKTKRMWTVDQKQSVVDAGYANHVKQAAAMLDMSNLPANTTKAASWAKIYRDARVLEGLTKLDAAQRANNKYTEAMKEKK